MSERANMKASYSDEQKLFIDYYKSVRDELTESQRGVLLDFMVDYLETASMQPIEDQIVRIAFNFIRNGLQRVTERYENRRKVNKANVMKRWHGEDGQCTGQKSEN